MGGNICQGLLSYKIQGTAVNEFSFAVILKFHVPPFWELK
jgi:hypothetical protein